MSEKQTKKDEPQHIADKNTAEKDPKVSMILDLIQEGENCLETFLATDGIGGALTSADRKRLVGAGVRNNGFIDKAFDVARGNPQFMPPHFDVASLDKNMEYLEHLRQFLWILQQLLQAAGNSVLVHTDSCYRDALRIYSSLREQARNKVDGAEPLFNVLKNYFHFRRRMNPNNEPSEAQIERDIKALLHGKADGEIVIKNEKPELGGGLHEVIDHVHKGRSAFKGSVEEHTDNK